ncbi:unnamed protein product [Amoebophrya sp. A120]|nr:unnamed protein product [Amoebophrya sp. A120]|eukprot:GSA120T00025360001.1
MPSVTCDENVLCVKKLSGNATVPTKGSKDSAGYDLSAAHETEIPAQGKGLVKTDLAIKMPAGVYGRVAPRSGLAHKKHIDVGAGVIDADYRGNVGVVLFNHAQEPLKVEKGDRVAQLILEKYLTVDGVRECEDLDETDRGAGGFGSTGVSAAPPS